MALKRFGLIGLGILLIVVGYWVGFVGQTDTEYRMDGPQGPGVYEIKTTYPIAGIVLIIGGLGAGLNGLFPEEDENDELGPPPTDQAPGDVGGSGAQPGPSNPPGGEQPPASTRAPPEEGQPAGDPAGGGQRPPGGQRQRRGQPPASGGQPGPGAGQPPGDANPANSSGQDTIACPDCGQPVSARAQFCTNCGANVAGE